MITIDFKINFFIKYTVFDCLAVLIGNTGNNPAITQPPPPYQPPPGIPSLRFSNKIIFKLLFFLNVISVGYNCN